MSSSKSKRFSACGRQQTEVVRLEMINIRKSISTYVFMGDKTRITWVVYENATFCAVLRI